MCGNLYIYMHEYADVCKYNITSRNELLKALMPSGSASATATSSLAAEVLLDGCVVAVVEFVVLLPLSTSPSGGGSFGGGKGGPGIVCLESHAAAPDGAASSSCCLISPSESMAAAKKINVVAIHACFRFRFFLCIYIGYSAVHVFEIWCGLFTTLAPLSGAGT